MLKGDNIPTPAQCVTDYGIDPTTVENFKSYSVTSRVNEFDLYDGDGELIDTPVGSLYVCATDQAVTDTDAAALDNLIGTFGTNATRIYLFSKL